ncbi:MAG: hypothetical protein PHS34_08050 [Candidatus Omnitrophica bacterium]|nr:hypothetical protein [Candidatus Omnitrophota bacterium]
MSVWAYSRGHKIEYDLLKCRWIYSDNKEIFDDSRPCVKCGKYPTKEGYDACLGFIPNIKNACCGHGVEKGYIDK